MAMDQVEEIKQKVDILELVGQSVTLKKAGRHYKGLCPFHSEKTPSFIVSPERQSYKCFGCGEGGDVYSFLQKYEGMSFLEALESLAKRTGVTLESYRPTAQDVAKKRLLEVMSLASEYYKYLLTKHEVGKPARAYLKKRGISNEAVGHFELGYAPAQWQGVSDYLMKKKKYQVEELLRAGLVIRNDGGRYYDRFRGRVMFPLKDHRGSIVGFSGRTLSSDTKEAKYINSPETALYSKSRMLYGLWENRQEVRKSDQMVVVEGELDVIPSWQVGVRQVVAIKGSAFTEEMARLVMRYTRNVIYALDADEAGREAVKRAVKVADPLDLSIRVVQIEGGKDPGDVAGADAKRWKEMVKGAALYWDFLIESTCAKHDPGTGEGARKITEEVLPELSEISNMVVRAHYTKALAKKLGVPEEMIYEEMERQRKKLELAGLKKQVKEIETESVRGRRERVEEYLLAIALQNYPTVKSEFTKVEPEWMVVPVVGKLLAALTKYEGEWSIKKFAGKMPSEMQEMIDRAYLVDLSEIQDVAREWGKVSGEVEELYVRARVAVLSKEMAKLEKEGKEKELVARKEEFGKLSRRLSGLS